MGKCTYVNRLPGERAKGPNSIHHQRKDNHCPFEQKIHSWGPQGLGQNLPVALLERKRIFAVWKRGAVLHPDTLRAPCISGEDGGGTQPALLHPGPLPCFPWSLPCTHPPGSAPQYSLLWISVQRCPIEHSQGALSWEFPPDTNHTSITADFAMVLVHFR